MQAPKLTRRKEFEEVLRNYHMSEEAKQILHATPFVLMVAPTAAGRNTIINELIKTGHYYFIVSDTTRPKRINNGIAEQDGVEYFFRSEDEILRDLRTGRFVEAAVIHSQQVSGVSIREIERAHQMGKIAITDIEVVGTKNIARIKTDVIPIFVLPPSFEEWLRRIKNRGAISDEEIKNRLESAVKEFKTALESERFIFVINNHLDETVKIVDDIARYGKHNTDDEQQARALAEQLHEQTVAYLAQI